MLPDLPGWDSLSAVSRNHGWSEMAGIAFLAFLVLAEIITYKYGHRKDYLIEQEQIAANQRHDEEMAQLHMKAAQLEKDAESARAAIAEANAETAKANERTAELKLALEREIAERQPRTITPEQHTQIATYLGNDRAPKDLPLIALWKLFDEEAERFAKQVIAVLRDSGFNVSEGHGPMTFGERGAWIVVRDLPSLNSTPNAIGVIQAAFREILHINFNGVQRKDPFPDMGEVVIAIGAKP